MQTRRIVAVVVVVVLVVAAALLIHGCQVSQTNNSLKTYAGTVSSYVTASDENGGKVFKALKSGDATGNLAGLESQLTTYEQKASNELIEAQDLATPDQMATAQQSFVQMMKLRYDGIEQIASNIQGAMTRGTALDDLKLITTGTSMLYASDVIYKTSVGTAIAAALNTAGLQIGGTTGATINTGQVVPDLGWLNSTTVGLWLGATLPSKAVNSDQKGLHGHSLNSVSVDGTALSPGGPLNTIPVSKTRPTFELNITNGGDFNEYQVECKVKINGTKDSNESTIAETTPQENTSCSVTLPTPAPTGAYTVTAEVVPVPGEKRTDNNTLTFNVDFN